MARKESTERATEWVSKYLKIIISDREAREGYALYQRWTTAHPHLAYLLTSGERTNAALPAIRDGVVAFLAKPFGLTELFNTVQALLSEHTHYGVPAVMTGNVDEAHRGQEFDTQLSEASSP